MLATQRRLVAHRRAPMVRPRRRWVPPSAEAAAPVTSSPGYVAEPFEGSTLKSGWALTGEPVTVANGGVTMSTTGGNWSQLDSPIFNLAKRSITWEWEPHQTTTYMDMTLRGSIDWVAQIYVDSGDVYWWIYDLGADTLISPFVAADWRWIRVEDDITSSGTLTMRRSADGQTWTTVATTSTPFPTAQLSSMFLRTYAES